MFQFDRRRFLQLAGLSALGVQGARAAWGEVWREVGKLGGGSHSLTLLFTNDFHSAFEPIPAYWRAGSPRLGGAAHLATLVERQRERANERKRTSFLLDSGDMFTGTLSYLTRGEALMEFMSLLRYDAMGVGNHEFDYGWEIFDRQATRVPFPVVCANIRYKDSGHRFCRPYTLLERDGVRLAVIGVIGLDARSVVLPSKVAELEFTDPVTEVQQCVDLVRETVDVVVVLGHQGLPGPMQTDAENDPSVQRTIAADLDFCGAVSGIDVYLGAHSHHGIETPIVHPKTGTLLVQTYGYGTRLGVLDLEVKDRKVVGHHGELVEVRSDELPPHAGVAARVAHYRHAVAAEIGPPLGRATARFVRRYHHESPLGNYVADVMRACVGAEVGITNAGGLRADLPEGELDRAHVLDAFPFVNAVVAMELRGGDLREVLEHGCSLERGMVQISGIRATYDPQAPVGARVREVHVGEKPLDPERLYRVATHSFLAEGGDRYSAFLRGKEVAREALVSDVVLEHLRTAQTITPPSLGRMTAVGP